MDLLQCLESIAIGNYRKKKIRPPITALAKRHNRSWSNLDLLQRLESATIGTAWNIKNKNNGSIMALESAAIGVVLT